MSEFRLSPLALSDLREILNFVAEDSIEGAERLEQRLLSTMEKLADFPFMGHVREDLASDPVRFWSVYSYLIIYRPESSPLEILRVLHGSRDVRSVLGYS